MRKPIIAGNWKMNKTPSEAKHQHTNNCYESVFLFHSSFSS